MGTLRNDKGNAEPPEAVVSSVASSSGGERYHSIDSGNDDNTQQPCGERHKRWIVSVIVGLLVGLAVALGVGLSLRSSGARTNVDDAPSLQSPSSKSNVSDGDDSLPSQSPSKNKNIV